MSYLSSNGCSGQKYDHLTGHVDEKKQDEEHDDEGRECIKSQLVNDKTTEASVTKVYTGKKFLPKLVCFPKMTADYDKLFVQFSECTNPDAVTLDLRQTSCLISY